MSWLEFLIISENKLKIMLDKKEIQRFGLDCEELDYTNPNVRNSFWNILDIAEKECGFHAKGEKILIQFYPAKSGGEIFITKLGILSKSAERSLSESPRVAMLSSKIKIYRFDGLSALKGALAVSKGVMSENMRVFLGEGDEYYLIFEDRSENSVSAISEFGSELPRELESYIIERTELVEIT